MFIFEVIYNYIINWFYNIDKIEEKTMSKPMKKISRSRMMNCRNASSPYTEYETRTISNKNFIITDNNRRSRLGKSVSYAYSPEIKLVEDINFCSFIREWVLVD